MYMFDVWLHETIELSTQELRKLLKLVSDERTGSFN
jgi:hypothetical protein